MNANIGSTSIECDSVQKTINFLPSGLDKQLQFYITHDVKPDDYYIDAIARATDVTFWDCLGTPHTYVVDMDRSPNVVVRYDASSSDAQIMLPIK